MFEGGASGNVRIVRIWVRIFAQIYSEAVRRVQSEEFLADGLAKARRRGKLMVIRARLVVDLARRSLPAVDDRAFPFFSTAAGPLSGVAAIFLRPCRSASLLY